VILIGAGIFSYNQKIHKVGIVTKLPGLFQPEAQMLTQAIDPNAQTAAKNNLPDQPITADKNLPAYSFDNSACKIDSSQYLCLSKLYETITANYGATTSVADLKQRANINSFALSDCHPLMHVIGRTAAKSYATTSEAFSHGDPYCWSGYYHGIMEGMVAKISLKNLPSQLNKICADIPGKATYNFNYYNCVHGLGHGIMALLGDEVFDSLKMCDNLTGSWEQESCYGGVFMQNIIDSTNVADTDNVVKYLKPSEPLYPCTAVDDKYKGQCYLGQTSYALQVNGYNFKKVFDLCATVAEPFRDICNQSMGRDAANQAGHAAQATKNTCWLTTNANDQSNCVVGAVKEIISYYHAKTQAVEFCNILDDTNKSLCNLTADSYYAQL